MPPKHGLVSALATATAAACLGVALEATATAAPRDPRPGAPGVGDPLFPTLGNGGYDVQNYDLAFDFTPGTYAFTGTVKIKATATHDLSSFNLDTDGHTIESVTVDGDAAEWALSAGQSGQELTVTPDEALRRHRSFTVTVAYRGNGKDPRSGLSGWRYISDGGFVSAVQASRADTFAPVNDHPSDKATWSFHLTAPEGWTAGANGDLTGTRPAGEGKTTWDFRLKSPMAPELMGISVAKQTYLRSKGPNGVRLRHLVPSDQVEKYRPITEETGPQMVWLERKLGARFPFSTYGVQIVRDGYGDALENQTLSLFGPNWFTRPTYSITMVHELAHQYFGDSVTPKNWQQAWLNEGPATYFGVLWGDEHGLADLDAKMKAAYTKLETVRKTDGPPGKPKGLGGFNIYDGGALVLYALRAQVGDADFDAILKAWVHRFRDGNADSEDFIDNAVRTTGDASLRPFLEGWLYGLENPPMPGRPDWKQA
ncbi:M1 family metallopeptidase [Spirillospora sp. CA-294931]|uniref:M1 family metallopeptidase n=1 Tax=Spirillospora sp. CA-294931 TaxID=3240042 RepID=UPI003D94C7A8